MKPGSIVNIIFYYKPVVGLVVHYVEHPYPWNDTDIAYVLKPDGRIEPFDVKFLEVI